jgi:TetR/AcrR family transcriptional regulator, transcriptional repressor for nem operon
MTDMVINKQTVRSIGGMMTLKGDLTRETILVHARELIKRKGFAATTINDLLTESGTTKGNLYFHFADKEAVGLEVLKREQHAFRNFLERCFDTSDPLDGLDNLFRGALDKNRNEGFIGGCLFGNMALEASDHLPVFAGLVNEVFSEWIDRLEIVISKAQREKKVDSRVPAAHLAGLIVASIEGGIMQARLQKSEKPLQQTWETLTTLLECKEGSDS